MMETDDRVLGPVEETNIVGRVHGYPLEGPPVRNVAGATAKS